MDVAAVVIAVNHELFGAGGDRGEHMYQVMDGSYPAPLSCRANAQKLWTGYFTFHLITQQTQVSICAPLHQLPSWSLHHAS